MIGRSYKRPNVNRKSFYYRNHMLNFKLRQHENRVWNWSYQSWNWFCVVFGLKTRLKTKGKTASKQPQNATVIPPNE